MPIVVGVAAGLAALIHAWFFLLESLWFDRPEVAARFGVHGADQIAAVRPMAFNQGFYNLFLATGIAGGLLLVVSGNAVTGRSIVLFACACMVGAGSVLVSSNRRFAAAAAVQAVPPLLAIVAALVFR
jgi:putative membrane protein